jgi:hypothetical protein
MNFALACITVLGVHMKPGSLRVVTIDDQRWVVRTVCRIRTGYDPRESSLRFFNGAESRYVRNYPEDWPALPESELTSIFERAEPRS